MIRHTEYHMKKSRLHKLLRTAAITVGSIIALVLLAVAAIYLWPLGNKNLQAYAPSSLTYDQAVEQHAQIVATEKSEGVLDECTSDLYTHGKSTEKSVVMFHGVTACPKQFEGLAKKFFEAGYNVYVPRTPHHGLADKKQHGEVRSRELIDYVNQSVTLASGLGNEAGAVGLSGGGMLTTWASEYRPEVKRALILSPFYEPAAAQAPKWQLPFLNVLYGFHVAPDQFTVPATPEDAMFSYRALANYNIITKNLKSDPSNLAVNNMAVFVSQDDDQIDLGLARSIPQKIADSNKDMVFIQTDLPASWKLGHDIVSLENKNVTARSEQLFGYYLDAYEGTQPRL